MAIGISGTSPELLIGITYDSNSAEKSFRQVTSRIESVAQAHEKRLNKILNSKQKQSPNQLYSDKYFAAQEKNIQAHLSRVNNLYAKSQANRRSNEKGILTASLNDHSKHNNQINNVVGRVTQSYNQQIPALKNLGSLSGVYAAQIAGMGTVLNQKLQSGSMGSMLFGGAAGGGIASMMNKGQSVLLGGVDVNALRRNLGEMYKMNREIIKSTREIAGGDDGAKAQIQGLTEQNAQLSNTMKALKSYTKDYDESLKKAGTSSSKLLDYAKLTAIALAAWKITDIIINLGVAAAKAEQLQKAFASLGGDMNLMARLEAATFGAMSQVKLLSTVNYGAYMGIDIHKLPVLLEFASKRAMETGQSVDYMVQSIVTGLGRKSPMILDNLGLKLKDLDAEVLKLAKSSGVTVDKVTELEREFFLTEAAVNIANKAIKESAVDMDNLSISSQSLAAQWEDFTVRFGSSIEWLGGVFIQSLKGWMGLLDLALSKLGLIEGNKLAGVVILPPDNADDGNIDKLKIRMQEYVAAYKKMMLELNSGKAKEKSWAEQLAEQIDAQAKLRAETLKHIAILEDYANKYKDNADVMKLVNEQLREQKRILSDLDVGQSLQPKTQFEFGPTNRFAGRIPDMNPVAVPEQSGMFKIMQDTTNEFNEMRKHLLDLEGALGFFEKGSAEAKSLQDEIKRINEALNPKGSFEAAMESWNEFYLEYREIIAGVFDLAQGLFDSQVEALNNQLEVLQEIIRLENERWSDADARMQESGIKNTAYYLAQKKAHEQYVKGLQEREYKLKAKAWDADKDSKIAQTIMNTAQGIMGAWGAGPIIGAIMSALIASMGAVQLNTIMGQQNPYRRAQGGWIPGVGYGDNVNTLLTPGEFVVNRNAARENAQMLERINSGAAAEGGTTNVFINIDGTIVGEDSWIEETLVPGISRAIRKGYEL